MKILPDTHMLLWSVGQSKKLSSKARELLSDENNKIYYSIVSIWEATIKRLTHPDKIEDISPRELIQFCNDAGFEILPLRPEHVYALETISRPDDAPPHKDPFDRILIAQAKSEGMNFLTHDELLEYYNEPCIIFS